MEILCAHFFSIRWHLRGVTQHQKKIQHFWGLLWRLCNLIFLDLGLRGTSLWQFRRCISLEYTKNCYEKCVHAHTLTHILTLSLTHAHAHAHAHTHTRTHTHKHTNTPMTVHIVAFKVSLWVYVDVCVRVFFFNTLARVFLLNTPALVFLLSTLTRVFLLNTLARVFLRNTLAFCDYRVAKTHRIP